ncbi:hypothetical protein GPECTOR_25g347 [Gonium pectorale]|uniref:SET domain-containing protein n=1 Tax=Gonium pectorale TaxID=33097 RepID=A0A150GG47_GONPE|nr:hypothetical protein GPECTOR_25g347 [Gonium pectorale]|eukprot:KXZ48763.1 hypothetical protein GPECTOR_25g347 [Gonium pectorale]
MLVAVPIAASLTVLPGERCPFPEFIPQDVWVGLPWYAQLACRLLHERALGPASRFADYLPALPARVDLPAAWPRHAVAALQYPYLEQQILDEQEEWARLSDRLKPYLSRRRLAAEDLYWALAAVRSRTFAGPYFPTPPAVKLAAGAVAAAAVAAAQAALSGGAVGAGGAEVGSLLTAVLPALAAALGVPAAWQAAEARRAASGEPGTVLYSVCPFIDMFNHDSRAQSECVFAPWRGEFRVAAGEPHRRGAQVAINYGSQSNDALLQRYGFVQLDGNPNDRYVFEDLLRPLERALQAGAGGAACGRVTRVELADAARRAGAPAGSLDQVPVTAAGGFPEPARQAVAALLAELARRQPSPAAAGAAGAAPSEATLQEVLDAVCQAELAASGSSLADDEAALAQLAAWQDDVAARQAAAQAEMEAAPTALGPSVSEQTASLEGVAIGEGAGVAAAAASAPLGEGEEGTTPAVAAGEEPSPPPPPVEPPAELAVQGGEAERLRTVLSFRIAKKRVLTALAGGTQ